MAIYYLYIKTHNRTGLKYLGQTKRNPFEYKGSGIHWLRHLKQHGNDVSTQLIGVFDKKDILKLVGQFLSKQLNVVKSKEWANIAEENGSGGYTQYTLERNRKISQTRIKKGLSKGTNNPMNNQDVRDKCAKTCKKQVALGNWHNPRPKGIKLSESERQKYYRGSPWNKGLKGDPRLRNQYS